MIICNCRNIRESAYECKQQLIERVLQNDYRCGKCRKQFINQCPFDGPAKVSTEQQVTEWTAR